MQQITCSRLALFLILRREVMARNMGSCRVNVAWKKLSDSKSHTSGPQLMILHSSNEPAGTLEMIVLELLPDSREHYTIRCTAFSAAYKNKISWRHVLRRHRQVFCRSHCPGENYEESRYTSRGNPGKRRFRDSDPPTSNVPRYVRIVIDQRTIKSGLYRRGYGLSYGWIQSRAAFRLVAAKRFELEPDLSSVRARRYVPARS